KRHFDRYEGLEIVVAVLAPAGADTRPLGAARQGFGIGARTIGIISRPTLKIAAICWRLGIACALAVRPFGRPGLVSSLLLALRCALSLLPVAAALEQGIFFEFVLDIGDEVEIGQLQQLDRLHQLRRHHERMALPDFESLAQ